ncbi:MAG: preprotein translocase subunit SecA [Planctomycetota bacterium]|nr:MAG: preprotein translocase subunit SecA [Planctomycetota bacterium]
MKLFGSRNQRLLNEMLPTVEAINALEPELARLSDAELRERAVALRERVHTRRRERGYERLVEQAREQRHGGERELAQETLEKAAEIEQQVLDEVLVEAFALVREASKRTLGMRHYDVQLIGGIVLHQGKIAEMVTGEGKTLVATLPAFLNALLGHGVHVITVNDYLARRDRDWNAPVMELLGLTVGVIQQNMSNAERQRQYACDITYGTNNEFGFDYLRDNMKVSRREQVQRELYYAIVDEVDSILIDEARTPLIISGAAEEATEKYYIADRVARALKPGIHFEVKEKEHQVLLTEEGVEAAQKLVGVDDFYTGANMDWPHHIDQALKAHHLYKRDKEYVVRDGEIIIVDEFTGRLMPGRRWSDGLHQAVEAKEGLKIKEENQTLATVTIQNFFRLYTKLSGMTGTAQTEAEEFHSTYKLDAVTIPTNRPLIRESWPDVVYRTAREKMRAIADEIERVRTLGRPLLVGTIAVERSELLSDILSRRGIPHEVLNAKHHEREAHIVAGAGQLRAVTVATNMAGRGTDILLGQKPESPQDLRRAAEWVQEVFWHKGMQRLRPEQIAELTPEQARERLEAFAAEGTAHKVRAFIERYKLSLTLEDLEALDADGRRKALWKALKAAGIKDELELYRKTEPIVTLLEARENVGRYFEGGVAAIGGLHVLATERHESRRIDNQLRGRCGRQGDPGSSQFFLSLEDDLMRIFAPERVGRILERLGMVEGQEISHPMVTRAIERAQKKVEARNFDIRKNLLEYDKVMDEQRKLVYEMRNNVLEGADTHRMIVEMIEDVVGDACDTYVSDQLIESERDYAALCEWANTRFGVQIDPSEIEGKPAAEIERRLVEEAKDVLARREAEMGHEAMRTLERFLLLQKIDEKWKDHLKGMDQLRSGIGMRGYAQEDPKLAYKKEGFQLFRQMMASIQDDVTSLLFKLRLVTEEEERMLGRVWRGSATETHGPAKTSAERRTRRRPAPQLAAVGAEASARAAERRARAQGRGEEPERAQPVHVGPKVGRNDPCPCGSGKKYKKCCFGR